MSGSFFVIGGYSLVGYSRAVSTIGRFDLAIRRWMNAGDLVTARAGHNVIYDGSYLLVIGGYADFMSEKCSITNGQVACTSQTPQLNDYAYYPEVHLVPAGYCTEMS